MDIQRPQFFQAFVDSRASPISGPALVALLAGLQLMQAIALAGGADPKLPSGMDPGGIAVAVVTEGIDYTDPAISARLARDGEGDLIGWDFVENDHRPFASSADEPGTRLARRLSAGNMLRLVSLRIDKSDPLWLAKSAAYVVRTPARIMVVEMETVTKDVVRQLREIAPRLGSIAFVLLHGPGPARQEAIAATKGIPNIGAVSQHDCSSSGGASEAVALITAALCPTALP